ncbi:MAG: Ig-like domain-containing protein, partial [Pseudomonadota bacterium]|nr:Ig-like domain-containing protein [Pseudomonadota bacterium]
DGPANGITIANEFSNHVFQDSARIIVSNNVVNAARYGIYYGNFQFGTGLHDSLIAHNTVYRTDLAALQIDDAAHTNTRIEQNLVVQEPGRVLASVAGSGLTFARNGWWGGTPPAAVNGVGDINADPGFVNPGSADALGYRLAANSPMASAGLQLALVGADFDAQARTAPTSLGAFEVTAVSPRMGIAAVAIGHDYRLKKHHYAASVAITDAAGMPVAGATVSGRWSGALSGSFDAVTNSAGLATMPTLSTRSSKSVTFTVTAVSRSGYVHDAALDQQTSVTFLP